MNVFIFQCVCAWICLGLTMFLDVSLGLSVCGCCMFVCVCVCVYLCMCVVVGVCLCRLGMCYPKYAIETTTVENILKKTTVMTIDITSLFS